MTEDYLKYSVEKNIVVIKVMHVHEKLFDCPMGVGQGIYQL